MTAVVLASGSSSRAEMLTNAGVRFVRDAADVDENAVKEAGRRSGRSAGDVARMLAREKAVSVTARHPGALVIGADQMLECDGVWFDKPEGRDGARAQLLALRGKTHRLLTAAVLVRDGALLGDWLEVAEMTMRPFGDVFLDAYLDDAGGDVTHSVGAYFIEETGIQLFERIAGDTFTIRGLPLLAVLEALREHGAMPR
jgi:septum formation protein